MKCSAYSIFARVKVKHSTLLYFVDVYIYINIANGCVMRPINRSNIGETWPCPVRIYPALQVNAFMQIWRKRGGSRDEVCTQDLLHDLHYPSAILMVVALNYVRATSMKLKYLCIELVELNIQFSPLNVYIARIMTPNNRSIISLVVAHYITSHALYHIIHTHHHFSSTVFAMINEVSYVVRTRDQPQWLGWRKFVDLESWTPEFGGLFPAIGEF